MAGFTHWPDIIKMFLLKNTEFGEQRSPLRSPPDGQLDALEKFLIRQALEEAEGVQTRAAEKLGISERVLRYKLKKYGM
jgi:DNA-binding NtrC family response regulator